MIINPLIPNPVFETLPPPWQLVTLDAWTASVNLSLAALYQDPTSFNTIQSTTAVQTVAAGNTATVVLPNVNFQTPDNPYNNANGVFTAPASGIYRFESNIGVIWPVAPGSAQAWFSLNNSPQTSVNAYTFFVGSATSNNVPASGNGAVTVQMNQNDTMRIIISNTGANALQLGIVGVSSFSWFSGSMVR